MVLDRHGAGRRIVWLGDSTAAGVGASSSSGTLLSQVADGLTAPGISVTDLAVSGARVADVLAERHELTGEEIDLLMPPDWIAQRGEPCDGDPLPCAQCGPVRQACRPAGTWPLMLRQGA